MPPAGPATDPTSRTEVSPTPPASPSSGTGPEQYVFITPVWGEAYVERFVKLSLPSQISAGNLGAIPAARVRYLIFTRREHIADIRRTPAFRRLRDIVPVSLLSLDDLPDPELDGNPHPLQTAAYTRGIGYADRGNTAFVFLTPDILLGDGSIENMVRLADAGRRVVLVAGVRMSTDGAVACIARHRQGSQPEVALPPRGLVQACLEYLHPISTGHVVTPAGVRGSQHLYWRVGDHGLLVRGFHLHPLLVWPHDPGVNIRNTLDDEYISRACPDRSEWYTVTDTDEISVFEFSDPHHKHGMVAPRPLSDRDILRFIHEGTNPDHRVLVRETIRLHSRPIDAAEWEPVSRQADGFVQKYLDMYSEQGPPREDARVGPPEDAPEDPGAAPMRTARLRGVFRRATGGQSPNELSIPSLLLLALTAPLWVCYRILNYKIYRYLDRLNAEIITNRTQLAITRQQLATARAQIEQLTEAHKQIRHKLRKAR